MQDAFSIIGILALVGGLAVAWRMAFAPQEPTRRLPCQDWAELEACRERIRRQRMGAGE